MRAAPPIRDGQEAKAFDVWIRRDLTRRYGEAMHETVPANLLDLLEKLH